MIKNLDYQRYDKYFNPTYLKERNNIPLLLGFCYPCLIFILSHPKQIKGSIIFVILLFGMMFLYLLNQTYYYFLQTKDIFRIYFLPDKITIQTSFFKYGHIENIDRIYFNDKKHSFWDYIDHKTFYKKIVISANQKEYILPYNERYKDEILTLLTNYQKCQ